MKRSKIWKIPKSELQLLLNTSTSVCDVLSKLGFNPYSGNHKTLKSRIIVDKLDLSKLKKNLEQHRKDEASKRFQNKLANLPTTRIGIRRFVIKHKLLPFKCMECGLTEWNNKHLSLHLDHIDGDTTNNDLSNLRFLCPNCHSQTDTYAGKKTKKHHVCSKCNVETKGHSSVCSKCASKRNRRFNPSVDELKRELKLKSFVELSKKYGVSDTAIRKRCKLFELI